MLGRARGAMLAVMVGIAGCGGAAPIENQTSNLKPLSICYGQFLARHRGQPPANEAEFKAFVKALDPSTLQSLSVTDPESIFVSSRDNKPYVVLYGPSSGPPGPGGQPVVIYEQDGVGGQRFVASTLGAIEEVDDAEFRRLVPNAK